MGHIKIKAHAKGVKIGCRGSGLDAAKAGFKEIADQFDQIKDMYAELDKSEKDEFDAAIGEDLAAALGEGSKTQFESELETAEDLDAIWEKVKPLIAEE